jgi:hypothetical protein
LGDPMRAGRCCRLQRGRQRGREWVHHCEGPGREVEVAGRRLRVTRRFFLRDLGPAAERPLTTTELRRAIFGD